MQNNNTDYRFNSNSNGVLPKLFLLVISILSIIPIYSFFIETQYTYNGFIYLISILLNAIFFIGVAFILYRYRKVDYIKTIGIIQVYSLSLLSVNLWSIIRNYGFFGRFHITVINIFSIIVFVFFIVSCQRKGNIKKVIHDERNILDKFVVSMVVINITIQIVQEAIRVYMFYQNLDGSGWTSNFVPTLIFYLILIMPLFASLWLLKSKYRPYRNFFVIYSLLLLITFLSFDVLKYIISLQNYSSDPDSFSFLKMIGNINSFFYFSYLWVLVILKIVYWKQDVEIDKIEHHVFDNVIKKDEE